MIIKERRFMKRKAISLLSIVLLALSVASTPKMVSSVSARALQGSNVAVNGFFSVDPANQGSSFRAAIVMEIPEGIHVNSNKPLGKYAIPTSIKIDSPDGLSVTPVSFPAGTVRTFDFGGGQTERLAVYEGRAIMRFNVNVAPDAPIGVARVRVKVRFQSCSDSVCYPPATRDLSLAIAIVDANRPVNRINAQYFGGRRSRRS
jgi:DsbC/DsbD-like thiol-disulfide interchange protein